jgi:hypothetical protein
MALLGQIRRARQSKDTLHYVEHSVMYSSSVKKTIPPPGIKV